MMRAMGGGFGKMAGPAQPGGHSLCRTAALLHCRSAALPHCRSATPVRALMLKKNIFSKH